MFGSLDFFFFSGFLVDKTRILGVSLSRKREFSDSCFRENENSRFPQNENSRSFGF